MGSNGSGKLTALFVERRRTPGTYGDGGGLYLQVSSPTAKSWVFRFWDGRRTREKGLGSSHLVSLAQARDLAHECRQQRRRGIDPIDAERATRAQQRLQAAKAITFAECFDAYMAAHSAGWRPKHAALWRSAVTQHALPVLGSLPVAAIDTAAVLRVLTPIWTTKTETATKVRARIEAVLDQARVLGHRDGDNPARWRGHLDKLLAAPGKVRPVEHRAAMPYADVPAFMAQLHAREGIDARALEFCILVAARSAETLGARRDEISIADATWTVPGKRMKGGKEHRIPLSPAALEIIKAMKSAGDLIFPVGDQSGRALYRELKRMGVDVSVHGFRSSFRDWAAEQTTFPNHVIEQALAHSIGKVEAAYRRSDLIEQRRTLMNTWARFCAGAGDAAVVPLRAARRR
jgi:integrase